MSIEIKLFCVVDTKPIPFERAVRKSNTCDDECGKKLKKIRRAIVDSRKCRLCNKPSTPEERKSYQAFVRAHPELKARRGKESK